MSLDDAINQARGLAKSLDDAERRRREQIQREREEILALGRQAAERLADWGNEQHVQVAPAKWHRFGPYRDGEGGRYHVIERQRCWVLAETWGIYDRSSGGPSLYSPVLLLADGTIKRFWPIPLGLHRSSMADDEVAEYVTGLPFKSIHDEDQFWISDSHHSSNVDKVKHKLASAIVRYERALVRWLD
ncbi:hypothetical protein ACQP00_43395 [Dactylosporangium sp. CS-047395]|uniref:hypothetical protein n=1 Tax=Dactylosporangium sp. CS-047395 TaxID=3239936 RepID=UPI003D8AAF45